jgi:peptide deformylase
MKLQRPKKHAGKSHRQAPAAPPAPPPVVKPDPASLRLVVYPDPVLKKVAKDVDQFDEWLKAFVERMKDLMVEHKGVGLAAPQVGVSLRVFVASPSGLREDAVAYINPVFSDEEGTEDGEEGCLSLPDIRTKVARYTSLRIEALDVNGQPFSANLEEFPARITQHENDHLDGILLLDRMSPVAKLANRRKVKDLEAAAAKKK